MGSDRSDGAFLSALARPSLFRRVLVAGGVAAALGGTIAALTAGLATTNLVGLQRETTLRVAAEHLNEEISEEIHEDGETLPAALVDELEDVEHVGARAAIFDDTGLLAGDPSLAGGTPGECRDVDLATGPHHACTVSGDGRTLTLAVSAAPSLAQQQLYGWGALIGALVGIVLGVLLSVRTARWGLAPLAELGTRVRRVRTDEPSASVLEPPATHAEVEELRRTLVELVDRLGGALAHARRFASAAAHELRTPLTNLAGELELLEEEDRPVDARELTRVRGHVDDLRGLVERLLVLTVPERFEPHEAVDLGDVAEAAVGELSTEARSRVRLSADQDVLVLGDPTLLQSALVNAVDNSLKFSTGPVDVHVRSVRGEAWLEVRDEGPGLSGVELDRAFEPFYRAPSARSAGVEGHGIGLALIAHVTAAHGGRAELVDVPSGAHLRMRMPLWSNGSGRPRAEVQSSFRDGR